MKAKVGENIKNMRLSKHMTQADVARQAGVSQAAICQIERGTRKPSLQIGKELSVIFDCSMDDLLK